MAVDIDTFAGRVASLEHRFPTWFAIDREEPPSGEAIRDAEGRLGVKFHEKYVQFLRRYGGGFFAFAVVYAVGGDFDVVVANEGMGCINLGFLAVSDNGAGDLYGFKVAEGECEDAVFVFDHETRYGSAKAIASDFFEFLQRIALRGEIGQS